MNTMCLLSYYESGIQPNLERLHNGADWNEDGYGFAIVSGDQLIIGRGMDSDRVITKFAEQRILHPNGPAMFHSRMTTGGNVDKSNCHPFYVGRDRSTVVAHNGILFTPRKGEPRSDTRIFAEDILPQRFRRVDRPGVRQQLERYLGKWNKIAMLTVNPRFRKNGYIFNESGGDWVSPGEWHSNYGYMPLTATEKKWREYSYWDDKVTEPWDSLDCPVCLTKGTVDDVTLFCNECHFCYDCRQHRDDCLCYVPSKTYGTPTPIWQE